MPEANAATQGAAGAGGPGVGSAPAQPPAQPAPAEAPPSGGAAPAAPPAPAAGAPPADGTVKTGTQWGDAAKTLRKTSEEKRNEDRDREITRLRAAEKALKSRLGDDYLGEIERRLAQPAAPQPQAQPQPTPQYQPPTPPATGRGLDPRQAEAWHTDNFNRFFYGYTASEIVTEPVQDPSTGETHQVPRQVTKQVPPNPQMARAYAEEHDALLRSRGIRPPWDGYFGLTQQVGAPSQAPEPVQSPAQVEDILEQREVAREAWEAEFATDLQQSAQAEFGADWFAEPVQLSLGGKPVTMPRGRALYFLCKPSREYPEGLPMRAGLMKHMLDETMARYRAVSDQVALSRVGGLGGGVPSSAQSGPPMGPSERQARAAEMERRGIVGGNFAAEPPPDAAKVYRVPSVGGRSSGLPR